MNGNGINCRALCLTVQMKSDIIKKLFPRNGGQEDHTRSFSPAEIRMKAGNAHVLISAFPAGEKREK